MQEHGERHETASGTSTAGIEWDLLEPTLTPSDDNTGFARPWNPWIVLVLVVICKPMVGTLLLAWNAWRLGLRRQVIPLALSGVLVTSVILVLSPWFVSGAESREQVREAGRMLGFVLSVAGAGLGLLVMRSHQRRYRLAVVSEAGEGSLWVVGTGFVLAALFAINPWLMPRLATVVMAPFWK